jgi:hypothetical protein
MDKSKKRYPYNKIHSTTNDVHLWPLRQSSFKLLDLIIPIYMRYFFKQIVIDRVMIVFHFLFYLELFLEEIFLSLFM